MIVGTKTRLSGASQVCIDAIPVPRWSGLIATYDAKHARDMDFSRLRYDDGPSATPDLLCLLEKAPIVLAQVAED